jgi:predicted MFS family arabinose efflux permease
MTRDNAIRTARLPAAEDAGHIPAIIPPRLVALIFLSALAVLPVNMVLPSLPEVAAAFRADPALVNLSVTGYAIMTAIVEIVAGAMSDRYGRRRIVLLSLSSFVVASIGCALAGNIGVFLVFRAMQASIGACFSVSLVIIKETSGMAKAASKFGYLAMAWAIAPMLGPTIGGLLDELLGWRASFVALSLLGLAALALSAHQIRQAPRHITRQRHAYFASYRRLLRSQRFWAYSACMTCSMATFYIFLGGAPLIAARSFGTTGTALGLLIGIVPTGFLLGSYLAGRYASRTSPGAILILARLATCAGLFLGLTLSISGAGHILAFFGPCVFIGIGNGLTMPAANAGILSVHGDLAGTTVGFAAAIRIAGGALIASAAGLLLAGSGGPDLLFVLMLASASLALLGAIWAALLDRGAAA